MKKILLILFVFVSLTAFSQQKGFYTITSDYDLSTTSDTLLKWTNYFDQDHSVKWAIWIQWSGLTGTLDGTLTVKYTGLPTSLVSDAAYLSYPQMGSVTMDSATGNAVFEDSEFMGSRIGLFFDKNNITAGTIKAYIIIK